jgi:hypothetical protein
MTDDGSSKALEDWEMTPEQKYEAECKEREDAQEKTFRERMEAYTRDKHLITSGDMWHAPWPAEAYVMLLCHDSYHTDPEYWGSNFALFYWIAVRLTEDEEAFEIVRVESDGRIVEHYPGRFEVLSYAVLAAESLRLNWKTPVNDHQSSALSDERDLSRNLRLNPWARAVWERKHPEGPVLVVWHLEPLPLYVAGWLPFAGSRCVPSLADFLYQTDPARVDASVDFVAKAAFDYGPSDKMIARAKSIAASYAANGRKGGRPKKGKKAAKQDDSDQE